MGFEELLGNERLKENLSGSLRRDRVSHFYLIAGPSGSGKRTLARMLAAGLLCDGADKPVPPAGRYLPTRIRTSSPWTIRRKRPFLWI